MQTIKTAVVVVLLLFVLYGGWIALNGNDTPSKVEEEFGDAFQQVTTPGPIGPSDTSTAGNTASACSTAHLPKVLGLPHRLVHLRLGRLQI